MGRININIDETLLKEGLRLTHFETKTELVNYALEELVKRKKRKQILKFEGKIKWGCK